MLCSYDAAAGMISKRQRSKAIVSDLMVLRRAEKLISLEHSNSSEMSVPGIKIFSVFPKIVLISAHPDSCRGAFGQTGCGGRAGIAKRAI
jgi:hypothetical protein